MPKLSVIVITHNEESNILACLSSVTFADEIIVVDSGSTDNTVKLCSLFTDKIIQTENWPGFGIQKNRALSQAQGEWVLSLDADESVTCALQEEIQQVVQISSPYTAFRLPRLVCYCGRWLQHCGRDYVVRLFQRQHAQFSQDLVHEKVEVRSGLVGTLQAPLLHYSFSSLEKVLEKVNRYSSASARMQYTRGQRAGLTKAILHGGWAFLRTYVLKRGFLDGREGFMLAVSNAEGTYYRYVKLMYLHAHRYCDHL